MPDKVALCESCSYCIPTSKPYVQGDWVCTKGTSLGQPRPGLVMVMTKCTNYNRMWYPTRFERILEEDGAE